MEYAELPPCCQQTLGSIRRILESGNALAVVIALAPGLTQARPAANPLAVLWQLSRMGSQYLRFRSDVRQRVSVITRRRVRDVITLHCLEHAGALERDWTRMLEAY